MVRPEDLARLAGREIENSQDEHVRYGVYVDATGRLAEDEQLLRLWGELLAADPDATMAEGAALGVLEADAPQVVVAEVERALGERPLIAKRLAELRKVEELSTDAFSGDPETERGAGVGDGRAKQRVAGLREVRETAS
jgi:hypothetical protein